MAKRKRYGYKFVRAKSGHSRSNKKNRKIIKLFLCLFLLSVFVFLACFGVKRLLDISDKFDKLTVKNIEVVGTNNITKAEIKELLPFKIGDNLLKINLSEAENEIKNLKSELKNIVISRRWQKVRVKLYERTPEAFIAHDGVVLGIDFDDSPFPLRGFMSAMKVPKITYNSRDERKHLLDFIERFKTVCGGFLDNIAEMKFSNTGDIVFIMNSGAIVSWGEERSEHLSSKFRKFQKVYVDAMAKYEQLEYIDMTFYDSGRAIVKPLTR
ncbi:MAG: cell division protein FtsQ/DivIB [Endomicrobium sp.]|nr:cell division protein FtsQ/DivIB [Endomicrobium sp.]